MSTLADVYMPSPEVFFDVLNNMAKDELVRFMKGYEQYVMNTANLRVYKNQLSGVSDSYQEIGAKTMQSFYHTVYVKP